MGMHCIKLHLISLKVKIWYGQLYSITQIAVDIHSFTSRELLCATHTELSN